MSILNAIVSFKLALLDALVGNHSSHGNFGSAQPLRPGCGQPGPHRPYRPQLTQQGSGHSHHATTHYDKPHYGTPHYNRPHPATPHHHPVSEHQLPVRPYSYPLFSLNR